ncbi:M56 family metallopeptidase [Niabella ginsenosidivorans]|uniref:M56 family metallopeptidase n=1 Tax=Niabella ginsenosidivorans TaxID=1176587 RepID=UPI0009FECF02|nr:M56 family metallopeptidase [Niabella ginsenosidivorans]
MKTIVPYLLQVFLCSGLLYSYYLIFLKNKKFHGFNRAFLLSSFVISLAVPLIKIPYYISITKETGAGVKALVKYNELLLPEVVVTATGKTESGWGQFLFVIYISITLLILLKIIAGVIDLLKQRLRNNSQKWQHIRVIETGDPSAPYSFFNWLFWSRNIDENSERGKKILQHEIYHIQQLHSIDNILTELITAMVWINPFFWLIKNELKAVHEFSADAFASRNSGTLVYAEILVTEAIRQKHKPLVNSFFNNQLKRRINLLTKTTDNNPHRFRQWMAVPLFLMISVLFIVSCQQADHKLQQTADSITTNPVAKIPDSSATGSGKILTGSTVTLKDTPTIEVKKFGPPKVEKKEPEIFTKVDKDAEYSGNWSRFLQQHLRGEVPVDNGAAPGNYLVIAQFVVDVNGNVSDVKLIKDPGFGMGKETIRVIKQSGKWKPAMMKGKPVKAYRKQPITFQVQEM